MSDDKVTVLEALQAAFQEVVPSANHTLAREDDLVDLGISSIAAIEMSTILGARYDIHLPEEDLAGLRTIGDFVDLIERLLAETETGDAG